MKKKPEYVEGKEALENFDKALGDVLKVPHSEIKEKLEAEKKGKPNKAHKECGKETNE